MNTDEGQPSGDAIAQRQDQAQVFAFARDLADFTACLEDAVRSQGGTALLAGAVLVLLKAAGDGRQLLDAIGEMLVTWQHGRQEADAGEEAAKADEAARREREQAWNERRAAEEEVTRTVECPSCGAPAGRVCRTAPRGHPSSVSHRGRFRLARSLNDGAGSLPRPGTPFPSAGAQCKGNAISAGRSCAAQASEGSDWCPSHQHPSGFPPGFEPGGEMLAWARENARGVDHGGETALFAAYWEAKRHRFPPRQRDWPKTWRDWMLDAQAAADRTAGRDRGNARNEMLAGIRRAAG